MTSRPEQFTFTGHDGAHITAYRWMSASVPRGIVQLTHGMGEHALRYDALAVMLTDAGFAVYAQDHRGHGATASPAALGMIGAAGWTGLVDDIGALSAVARTEHDGVPLVLLGHSMGSFAAQQYVLDNSADVDGLVLTGTAAIDLLEPALDLDVPMDLAAFNTPFAPARTDFDWLSRDDEQVDAYVADPLCGFGIDADAARQMFLQARPIADAERLASMRSGLPVFIGVGELDPVNGQLTLVEPLVTRYRGVGLDVVFKVYPGARHEILNETNRDEVFADLLAWLGIVVP